MRFWTVIGKSLVSEAENHISYPHKSKIGTSEKKQAVIILKALKIL